MTNQHLTDQEIGQLLKEKAAGIKLSSGEKQVLKYNLTERIALSDVTKPAEQGYRWWKYQLNLKGVTMPFLPILFAILLAGGFGTASLANSASPGDPLYSVDQWMERVQQRLTNKAEAKAGLYAKLSDERLKELEELRNTDPSQLPEKAKALWEEHQQEAIDRLAKSIEQVTAVQDQFKEKLAAANTPEQKAVFQKIIDHLGDVQQKREDRLTQVEDKTSPGLPNLGIRQKMQEMREEHQQEMQNLRNRVREELAEPKSNQESDDETEDGSTTTSGADQTAPTSITAQALEFQVPIDENGNIRLDLIDSDHDGIPDKDDNNPDWPPHTM